MILRCEIDLSAGIWMVPFSALAVNNFMNSLLFDPTMIGRVFFDKLLPNLLIRFIFKT